MPPKSGIIKEWADRYHIDIEVVQINDYVESINQYTAGGVDSTALIVGDFSNGNDGIVLKGKSTLGDLKGQTVNLVELSVSHYLLARALETQGLSEKDVTVANTPGSHKVFDSSFIPG